MNELDKIFQSKLENHTAEYSEQSWDKIQVRLGQEKSKPRGLPWLWISLLALVIVGAIYLWKLTEGSQPTETDSVVYPMAVNTNSDNRSRDIVSSHRDKMYSEITKNITDNINEVGSEVTNIAVNTVNTTMNASPISIRKKADVIVENEIVIKPTVQSKEYYYDNADSKIVKDNAKLNYAKESAATAIVQNQSKALFDGSQLLSGGLDNINKPTESKASERSDLFITRPLRTIGVSSYTTLQSDKEVTDISLSKSMMDDFRQDCPSFVTDRTGVYLDFYVSHELPFSSLKAKTQELDPYAELRANSEGPTYSFSAGARLTLMLPNGLGLKTGLNFSQVNEKFSYVDDESDIEQQIITKITTVDGVMTFDTNTIVIPGRREVISTNKYRSFDLPLLLSYEWDVRERTYMTVNGGIYLNLLFKESGKILGPTGEVIDINDTSGDRLSIFKNNIGLSLFGSVGLHYRMTGNIDLILEPNLRLLMKSATVDTYSVDHKWYGIGLITGMRYNF